MKSSLLVSVLGLLCSVGAWAQASAGFGAVAGMVTQSGADGMPDATVVLSNRALGTQVTMVTTDDGIFGATTVVPAEGYALKVARKGFGSWESGTFTVSAGQTLNFRVPLDAEGTAAKVEASAGLSPVDSTKSGTADLITPKEIETLPASGRRLDELIPLAPAVTIAEGQPGLMVTHGLPFSNTLLTDGLETTNSYYLEKPGIARQVSQDAVQDFQVLASDFSAEYGRAMGGIVNVATRSGTTGYHGSAYEYFRSRGLAANDPYAAGYDTRQLQHQAGADVGGPIYGHHLFFFANFEALYRNSQGLNRITNPLIADPTGHSVLASNCTATAAQCAAASKFLQSQMNVLEPLSEHSATGFAKIDYRRSERNTFSFDANASHWRAPSLAQTEDVAPNGGLIGDPTLREEIRYAKIGWTGTVSSVTVNDLRFGWFQDRISEYPTQPQFSTGPIGISIAGTTVGAIQPYTAILPSERRYQLVDNLHRTYGSHLFQFGADLSNTRDFIDSLVDGGGTYTYASLTAFAQDFARNGTRNYTSFDQTFGNPSRTFHIKEYNFYAEDTWRATPKLTVQYGLRYERPFLPQPTMTNTAYYQTASISSPWLDLAPRVGFAYMLDDRTVFRAGFGFYYAPFPGQLLDTLFLGNGLYQTGISVNPNQTGAPVFPNGVSALHIPTGTTDLAYATSKLRNPYTQQTNLAIERRIGRDSTLTIGYIRSRGLHLWTSTDVNLTPSSTTEVYTIDNAAGQATGTFTTPYYTAKNDANYAHVYQVDNNGSFWYDALAVQWRTRLSHGFDVWTSYTWSHAIDDLGASSALGFALVGSSTGDLNADRGRSALDQRQRAVIRWTWQPTLAGASSPVRHLLNGWAFSGIATLASGQPVTPLVLVQGQQFSAITMDYTSSLNGSGGWNRVPFDPVNSLSTGSEYNVDARLARSISFKERIKGTVAFEAFNLLNRSYATAINSIEYLSVAPLPPGLVSGPMFGVMKPVPGFGAGIASQGFPDGTNARRCQVVFRLAF